MPEVTHRVQCAVITRGCTSALVWTDRSEEITDHGRELLALNGWRLDHGQWICGGHDDGDIWVKTGSVNAWEW